jgi:hypothetical protein
MMEKETLNNETTKPGAVVDPRRMKAIAFFNDTAHGIQIIKLDKTTRAGGTVSLCSESIARKELLTLVCRTNENIIKAGIKDTQTVVGHPINVLHIARNSFCPKIQELTTKYPAIQKIGFIPLPNCDECHIADCPIRAVYETPLAQVDGFSLTYAKLQSLVLAENKKARGIVNRLLQSRNIILDEAHFLQESATVSVGVWQRKDGQESTLNFDSQVYSKLCESSPLFKRFFEKVIEIQVSIQLEIEKLKKKSQENHYLKHLAPSIPNPFYAAAKQKLETFERAERERLEEIQRVNPEKSWLETALMLQESGPQEGLKDLMCAPLSPAQIIKIQSLLITAIQNPQRYDLTEEQIVTLSKLLSITNADVLVLSYVKGSQNEQISLQAQDTLLFTALRAFLHQATQNSKDKRIIFTTATFGEIKIDKLLNVPDIKDYVWGDPLDTSLKFLVIADKSRISNFNFESKLLNTKALVDAIIERYGEENVAICAMSKRWAKKIGHGCTWYASDLTEGVSSSKRIWIMIGLAEKPVNAKDNLAIIQAKYHNNPLNLQGDELLHYISQKLRVDSVHNSTYQAISRAKDPNAKDRSVAIIVGAREEEVHKCLLWGPTRKLVPVKTERGLKFKVEIQNPIGEPHLTSAPLSADVQESLHIIDQWLNRGEIAKAGLNWVNIKKIVDEKGYVSAKRLVTNHGMDLQEVNGFLGTLQEYLTKEGIPDYVIVHDSQGSAKGIATKLYYGKQGETSIVYSTRSTQVSIVLSDYFFAIKAAVERAPETADSLDPGYFNHHVSSNIYGHLSEFFDAAAKEPNLCPGWIVLGTKTGERETRKLVRDIHCLGCWAPDYPRRFGNPGQMWVNRHVDMLRLIKDSCDKGLDALVSVNAFPGHKHPNEGGTPPISTIFIDIDVENEEFKKLKSLWEKGDLSVVPRLQILRSITMEEVLKQAKCVITYLKAQCIEPRILLSGFKGVHLFVDFPSLQFSTTEDAKQVTRKFLEELAVNVTAETGIKADFDTAVMGDVSRLCRIPNTQNKKASKLLGRIQYAVPLTIDEFMDLTPPDYDRLCSAQHYVQIARLESLAILPKLTKISFEMKFDDELSIPVVTGKKSVRNPEKLAHYAKECTREILNAEGYDELDIRPCFVHAREERVSLTGGNGHKMRIGAVKELSMQNLSIGSMVRWFDFCSDYNAALTERYITNLISAGYTDEYMDERGSERRKGYRCETIRECGFCLKDDCRIYQKKFGLEVK